MQFDSGNGVLDCGKPQLDVVRLQVPTYALKLDSNCKLHFDTSQESGR